MIAKEIRTKGDGRGRFARLAAYISNDQGKGDRVCETWTRNCESESLEWAAMEAEAVQKQNTRSKMDPTLHLLLSFSAEDNLSMDALKEIEKKVCEGIGFGEFQRVVAVHTDTNNAHMHVVINKVHPDTHAMKTPYKLYPKLAKVRAKIEEEYSLKRTSDIRKKTTSENIATDVERLRGQKSFISSLKESVADRLLAVESWAGFHALLSSHGLEAQEKGRGLVIVESNGEHAAKMSSIHRDLAKGKLEERLGVFVPFSVAIERMGDAGDGVGGPLALAGLYGRYLEYQQGVRAERSEAIEAIRTELGFEKNADIPKGARIKIYRDHSQKEWPAWLAGEALAGDPFALAVVKAGDVDSVDGLYREYKTAVGQAQRARDAEFVRIRGERGLAPEAKIPWEFRKEVYDSFPYQSWEDWLSAAAERGMAAALSAMTPIERVTGIESSIREITFEGSLGRLHGEYRAEQKVNQAEREKLFAAIRSEQGMEPKAKIPSDLQKEVFQKHPYNDWAFWLQEQARKNNELALSALRTGRGEKVGNLYDEYLDYLKSCKESRNTSLAQYRQDQNLDDKARIPVKVKNEVFREHPYRDWLTWLQERAKGGDPDALDALRMRDNGEGGLKTGDLIVGDNADAAKNRPATFFPGVKISFVTKLGLIVYKVDNDFIRDDGNAIRLGRNVSDSTVEKALKLSADRFGRALDVSGSYAFKDKIVRLAIQNNLAVTFADKAMEKQRKNLEQEIKRSKDRQATSRKNNPQSRSR